MDRKEHKDYTVLLVDDSKEIQELMDIIFKDTQYDLECVSCATEALELIQSKKFDCIMTDLSMPRVDGESFTKSVRLWEQKNSKNITPIACGDGGKSKRSGL